jgi:hypothetical protein
MKDINPALREECEQWLSGTGPQTLEGILRIIPKKFKGIFERGKKIVAQTLSAPFTPGLNKTVWEKKKKKKKIFSIFSFSLSALHFHQQYGGNSMYFRRHSRLVGFL